ncbi:MAG: outer membrane protein assembly factor BamE [Serpentinimonas sp.]|nr:outer membrane protein assembly factor BamE [Serpentinimonas sp.]
MASQSALRRAALAVSMAALLGAAGCTTVKNIGASVSTLGGLITPYKIDILQGNVVTAEQVQALQPGMSREQVRNILGTPLLTSAFHADRWDYMFTFQRQGQEPQQRSVVVIFQGDSMFRVDADELPTEEEFVATLDDRTVPAKPPVLQATEEQLRAFEERNRRVAPAPQAGAAASTPASTPAAPATSYPPLEPR